MRKFRRGLIMALMVGMAVAVAVAAAMLDFSSADNSQYVAVI